MNNSNSIDYNAKVLDFMAMTETGDPEVATKYLQEANWDETAAVNQFFSKIRVNNINNNNRRNVINIDNSNNNNILNTNIINNNNSNNNNNNRNKNNDNQEDEGFISKYLLWPFRAILGACTEKREVDEEEENRIFHLLPNKIKDSKRFCEIIKKRAGIIIFYTENNVQYLTNFINLLSRNTMMINLLKKIFVFIHY